MKENQKRLLVSLVAGSALSLTLGITVHADGIDETEPVTIQTASLSPGEENKENAIEAGTHEGTGAGAADGTGEETDPGTDEGTADALLPETDLNQTPPDSPVQNASALSFTGANQPGAASEENVQQTTVSVDGQKLTSGAADENGWDGENKTGWCYDGSSVSMVNNDSAVEIRAEGTGIDLSVAGFNQIGTLYADGDVIITGTGIVLIDCIDMLEGTKLNLLTNTEIYTDGSAAIFLKTEDGVYELINGSVAGVLDEQYTIPNGITLVVPDGGTLDMRVTTAVTEKTTMTDSPRRQGFFPRQLTSTVTVCMIAPERSLKKGWIFFPVPLRSLETTKPLSITLGHPTTL